MIDLFADAPAFDPQLSAYLLAAYAPAFPAGSVFLCVVDPGVGSARRAICVRGADRRFYIGPLVLNYVAFGSGAARCRATS